MISKNDLHRFTIHFDVDAETFHILGGLAKVHKSNPNKVAEDILLAWMAEVSRSVEKSEPSENTDEPKLVLG